jgi:hypothetical protein
VFILEVHTMRIEIWNQAPRLLSVMPVDMTGSWEEWATNGVGEKIQIEHHCEIAEAFSDSQEIIDRETARCDAAPEAAKAATAKGNAEEARLILAEAKSKRADIAYANSVLAAAKEEHAKIKTPEELRRKTGIPPLNVTQIPPTRGLALTPGQVILICAQHGKSYRKAQARGGVDMIGWPELLLPPPPVPLPELNREGKNYAERMKEQDDKRGTLL